MTKKRKIEILELLKSEVKKRNFNGLCQLSNRLFRNERIKFAEVNWLHKLIDKHRPKKSSDGYYWTLGTVSPRIKWINERIKEIK